MKSEYIITFINEDGKKRYLTIMSTSEEAVREKLSFMEDKIVAVRPTKH